MQRNFAIVLACASLASAAQAAPVGSFTKTATGIVVHPGEGSAREVRLDLIGDAIVHVTALDDATRRQLPSMVVVDPPASGRFTVIATGHTVSLRAAAVRARVSLDTGLVTFFDSRNRLQLKQSEQSIAPVEVEGKPYVATFARFNPDTTEAFYGLGQHQNGQLNLNGEDVLLAQHNMDVAVPFVVSDRNYGLLWDNLSITRFGNPKPYGLFGRDLKLLTPDGRPGISARYYVDGALMVTRIEDDIRYQYLKDLDEHLPSEIKAALKANRQVRVTWDGTMTSDKTGVHKMQLYASDHADLTIAGRKRLSVWRQNWNPWYHNFTVDFQAGTPVPLHLEWQPAGGMIAITHNDPLPASERHSLTMSSEVGTGLSYYYVAGHSIDSVIDGYRRLTGKAALLPKWTYGFWQSRQRYKTQDELLEVVHQYRRRGWPLDGIVQDWSYWPKDAWGSHDFDAARFPDPKAMVDAVHAANAHIMISIWGKFYPSTANYRELDAKGFMFRKNVELGTLDFIGYPNSHYDPYAAEARSIYYRQLHDKLVGLGFDAWWMDNTEPDVNSNERPEDFAKLITPTPLGPGALVQNGYALATTTAMAEGLAKDQPDKRQFILTRSGFAGIQRNSAAVWSGDTVARWNNLYDQISAGVSFSMSGIPNWTHDIGGYAQEARYRGPDAKPEDLAEWRELNLRWFQFGAFSPLFRSHGEEIKREIYEISPDGSPMRAAMVRYDKLRYRLMPYIYTAAADTWFKSGTIMRGLVMDFPHDEIARNVTDEYMFGHALLVAPVTEYKASTRRLWLPKGASWYGFDDGGFHAGGRQIVVSAPATRIPLFVRAGSILPLGPDLQYVDEKPADPITLSVYAGADGAFDLYEDDGVSNGYRRNEYSRIPMRYDERRHTLTIGRRAGNYPGMIERRTFVVRLITPGRTAEGPARQGDRTIVYTGQPVAVRL